MAGNSENEFRRGWSIVLVAFLAVTVGVSSTFLFSTGLFLIPVAESFGWSRGAATFAPFVAATLTALLAPFSGRLVDRFGVFPVFLPSLLGLAVGLLLLATLTADYYSYIFLMAIVAVLGAGTVVPVTTKMIVAGFAKSRGLALGLSLAGSGLGAGLVPIFLTPTIAEYGWRIGYAMLAGIEILGFLAIVTVIMVWRRDILPSAQPSPQPVSSTEMANSDRPLWTDRVFLILAIAFFLSAWAILTTVVHFVPMLTDAGISARRAGVLAGSIGGALIAGRIIIGYLLDRLPAIKVAQWLFVCVGAGLVILVLGGAKFALVAAIAVGVGIGAENDIMSFLVGRYYALNRFGAVYGSLFAIFLIGGSIGPAASGYLFDATGSYTLALLISSAALLLAALLLFALPKQPGLDDLR